MTTDLHGLAVFVAVAAERSFRAAGTRLGITRSAVSQGLRRFEERLGVELVRRTTRAVALTEAGARLYEAVHPALTDVDVAVAAVGDDAIPAGRLRLCTSTIAESFLDGALLAGFLEAYPRIQLDVTVSDEEGDIVAQGFDAAVRLGEVIEEDMVAIAVSSPQRQIVVGTPEHLRQHGAPKHPRDLPRHRCIGWRPTPNVAPYRWEFTERGRDFDVAVEPRVTTNDMGMMIRLACAGAGLTFGMEETFRALLARGTLVEVLSDFSAPFPGFYLYYPKRRLVPPKLRALAEYLRKRRRRSPGGASARHA